MEMYPWSEFLFIDIKATTLRPKRVKPRFAGCYYGVSTQAVTGRRTGLATFFTNKLRAFPY